MQIVVFKNDVLNIPLFMRGCGYHFFVDPVTNKESWSRRLGTEHFPRFHLYIKEDKIKDGPVVWIFDLHLDQKKARYEGQTAHNGEYDGPMVENEMNRIYSNVKPKG